MNRNQLANVISLPQKHKLIIDGWNMLNGASTVLPYGTPINNIDVDFGRLADQIAAKSNRAARFTAISCHLGVADPQIDPSRHSYEMAKIRQWERDPRVTVHQYINEFDAVIGAHSERNVDESVGADLLASQESGDFATVVLFSADADLSADLEETYLRCARGKTRTRVELARWENQYGLWLAGKSIWCHYLGEDDLARSSTLRANRNVA